MTLSWIQHLFIEWMHSEKQKDEFKVLPWTTIYRTTVCSGRSMYTQLTSHYLLYPTYKWRRQRHPTPVLLPGKSHGWRSLEGRSPWGRWGSDTTERLHFHFSFSCIGEGNGNPPSVLAWRIPGTGEPGGLPSVGSHRVGHDWSDLAAAAAHTIWFFYFFLKVSAFLSLSLIPTL